MGMDVVHILTKGRHDLRGLAIALVAERAPEDPHRVTAVDMRFTLTGSVPDDASPARHRPLAREILLRLALDARRTSRPTTHFTVAPPA